MQIRFYLLLIAVLLLFNCKPDTHIGLTLNHTDYIYGDTITLKHHNEFDSIHITDASNNTIEGLSITEDRYKLGVNSISIAAYRQGKKLQRNFKIKVLSDIPTVSRTPTLIKTYKHNSDYFTQGLEYHNHRIYESSGLYKKSLLTSYKLGTSTPLMQVKIQDDYFAEGLCIVGNKIYLLTWQNEKILVYDKNNFQRLEEINLPSEIHEGWGITYFDKKFYISNGSSNIFVLDEKFTIHERIQVVGSEEIYKNLNELEYHKGKIYANVWLKDILLEIDPTSGRVLSTINLNHYVTSEQMKGGEALNGITFLPNDNLIFTGKNWQALYEITF